MQQQRKKSGHTLNNFKDVSVRQATIRYLNVTIYISNYEQCILPLLTTKVLEHPSRSQLLKHGQGFLSQHVHVLMIG